MFRTLRHRKLRHRPWWRKLTKPLLHRNLWIPCRDSIASGAAIGMFFSMMPIPFQSLPAALIAMRAKANVPFAMACCWVTNPFTTLPIIGLQFQLGQWMRKSMDIPMPPFLGDKAASYTLGFISSGVILALCAYPLVLLFSAILPHHLPVRKKQVNADSRRPRQSGAN